MTVAKKMKTGEKIWKIAAVMALGVVSLRIGSVLENVRAGGVAVGGLLVYVLPIAVMIGLTIWLGMNGRMKLLGGWSAVFTKGWYILAASAILAYLSLSSPMKGEPYTDIPMRAVILIAGCLLTAAFEEIWFRGLIQGILLDGAEPGGKRHVESNLRGVRTVRGSAFVKSGRETGVCDGNGGTSAVYVQSGSDAGNDLLSVREYLGLRPALRGI